MSTHRPSGRSQDCDPLWYKDAILYEVHVRGFHDANGDGIGDFSGLIRKLDYLQELGVTAVWLLPFYPSPLRDDGYDIADYAGVHPSYGTMQDFRHFVREAHRRDIRVVMELVCNHTSNEHPWFQRARRAKPGSVARDFYVWSDNPNQYADARIIFKDFEQSNWAWDPVAQAYYWHRFYGHQPDLNFASPHVRRAIVKVLDFWLETGVDGFRLDAIPYLHEREGTDCENLPETHGFLKELRRHIDERYSGRMLLAEANQWPEEAVKYFGAGDECHMAFHFPLMPRLFMAIRMEDRLPIIDILTQTPPIPDQAQWALFLRNHDELTLEMVTEDERDYMWRVYAQDPHARINLGIRRRLAPLLNNNRRRIELMNGLLFSLPGTPVIYYGDEIGMGDNIYLGDRNGVRTPMQWSVDRNAGFSQAHRYRLYLPVIEDPEYHYFTVNVENQERNRQSLLWWMRRLVGLRRRYRAFGRGSLKMLHPENPRVLAYLRHYENERILVVANLSRFTQHVELDLSDYEGTVPVELFGRTKFPPIGALPYFLTLGPHGFYWFALEPAHAEPEQSAIAATGVQGPVLAIPVQWVSLLRGRGRETLGQALLAFVQRQPWFADTGPQPSGVTLRDAIEVSYRAGTALLTLVEVEYVQGEPQTYVVPVTFAGEQRAGELRQHAPDAIIARAQVAGREGVLCDALGDPDFCQALLEAVVKRRSLRGERGRLSPAPGAYMLRSAEGRPAELEIMAVTSEQESSTVCFDNRLVLKLLRRVEGVSGEAEIGRFLTEQARFPQVTTHAGSLEYVSEEGEPVTLAIFQRCVSAKADGWTFTLGMLAAYYDRISQLAPDMAPDIAPAAMPGEWSLPDIAQSAVPPLAKDLIGAYLEWACLLGRRTAQFHLALALAPSESNLAPEPFTSHYQRSLYQSMRSQARQTFEHLRKALPGLSDSVRLAAELLLECEHLVLNRFQPLLERRIQAVRIRCHGNFHLRQVLCTDDIVISNFGGDPARPLPERRLKRSPLRDVAGMLYSLYDAAQTPTESRLWPSWAAYWRQWVSFAFLEAYLSAGEPGILPADRAEPVVLLNAYLLERGLIELSRELNSRSPRSEIPLGFLQSHLGACRKTLES